MMHAATSGERQTPEEAKVAEDKESVASCARHSAARRAGSDLTTTDHLRGATSLLAHLPSSLRAAWLVALTPGLPQGGDPDRTPLRK